MSKNDTNPYTNVQIINKVKVPYHAKSLPTYFVSLMLLQCHIHITASHCMGLQLQLNLGRVEEVYTLLTEGASQKIVLVQASQEFSKTWGCTPPLRFLYA